MGRRAMPTNGPSARPGAPPPLGESRGLAPIWDRVPAGPMRVAVWSVAFGAGALFLLSGPSGLGHFVPWLGSTASPPAYREVTYKIAQPTLGRDLVIAPADA